jgi:hypothetical protein
MSWLSDGADWVSSLFSSAAPAVASAAAPATGGFDWGQVISALAPAAVTGIGGYLTNSANQDYQSQQLAASQAFQQQQAAQEFANAQQMAILKASLEKANNSAVQAAGIQAAAQKQIAHESNVQKAYDSMLQAIQTGRQGQANSYLARLSSLSALAPRR